MKSISLLFSAIAAVFCCCAFGQTPGNSPVVLQIDDAKLTLADLERRHPSLLFQARQKLYEDERAAVESVISEYLLDRQAEKEGTTVAALLEKHVDSVIAKDPSEESLRIYYEGLDTAESFETMRGQILQALRERRKQRAKNTYLQQLRAQAKVEIHLSPPRTEMNLTATPLRGYSDAPVMLVEYADYECPYCQQVEPALNRLRVEYQGKLAIAFKDSPLPMHSRAQKAAEAAQCADAQGKYWEFHDLLFSTQKLDLADLQQHARTLKLDNGAFDQCLNSGAQAAHVKSHLAEFENIGLQGTPTFFINGRMVSGVLTYQQFRAVIEEELAAALRANHSSH